MKRLTIDVPATAGGLGPGAGCLGLALDIAGTVEVEIDAERDAVEGPQPLCAAYRAWPAETLPGARFSLNSAIPTDVGLGDDVALAVAGLTAAARAAETTDAKPRIISLASRLGCDPGQVAAAVQGGLITAFCDGEDVHATHIASHLLMDVVLFLPETSPTRPQPASDPGRLAYLIAALMWGRWDRIGRAMRVEGLPAPIASVLDAARDAGAYAATPIRGSALLALAEYREGGRVAAAMEECGRAARFTGTTRVTGIREPGVQVRDAKTPDAS